MTSTELWMIVTAISVALPASLLGVFLLLKKMVMVADAVSHAVLPGIVIAYLFTKELSGWQFVVGALVAAMITTSGIRWLQNTFKTQEDAAIGTVFTSFFAIGVLLISIFAGTNTDIDQECVLYGDLETSVLDHLLAFGSDWGPKTFYTMLPLSILVILISTIFLPQWRTVIFNPVFAQSIGLKIARWELLLLLLISVHSVLSFESVGVVMVLGLLVLPPACALQFVHQLHKALVLSAAFAIVSCTLGVIVAIQLNISIAPTIITVNALILTFIVLFRALKRQTIDTKHSTRIQE